MKKSVTVLTICTFMSAAIFTSCNSPAEKVENAEENVTEANKELDEANEKYLLDIETFKIETAAKIDTNEKTINAFEALSDEKKKAASVDYKNKIAELKGKNLELKIKMENYNAEGSTQWESFKSDFNRDMMDLVRSLNEFTINRTK